ncbi:MAG: hypothetical protein NZ902_00850 [Acidilobaceae archaeon]|nr:hypothetical protein [Acidilobaceae archaeon]MCX8165377.1 hypothetical protein [Acidilobaceae archaeon]MDW7973804.1 hypothetical protein [Sulfolobales archaeon]
MAGLSALAAAWAYTEATLALRITEGLSSGIYASLLGFLGVFLASLSRLPLLRHLQHFSHRRLALLLSSLLALLSLPIDSPVLSYVLLSAAFGIASAAAFSAIVHDERYESWRSSLSALNSLSAGLTALTLFTWNYFHASFAPLLLLIAVSTLTIASFLMRPPLLSGVSLRSLEVFSDILSFRSSAESYLHARWEAARIAMLMGGLGALRVTVLSQAFPESGTLSLASYAAGSSLGAAIAFLHNSPGLVFLLSLPPLAGAPLLPPTVELFLLGISASYAQTAAITYVLERRPRDVFSASALLSLFSGAGAALIGALSLARPEKAYLLASLLALLLLLLSLLSHRRRWD